MTACPCPLCATPMTATPAPSTHPAIPDRLLLTCPACFLTLSDADYATFDAALYTPQEQAATA